MSVMQDAAPQPETGRRRPFALLVLIGIMLFKAVLLILFTLGTATLAGTRFLELFRIETITDAAEATAALVGLFLLGVGLVVSAVGLLMFRRTGWLLAMVLTGFFILIDIMAFAEGEANYVWMALNIATVFYLNQREVRVSVGATDDSGTGRVGGTAT